MDVGVFIPIGNNGWLISKTSPQYKPTFDLNKEIVQKAEHYDLDFALSMIKLRGFGGQTEFWDYNLESFTLMAGLAAVTKKIKLYATAATLVMPPAIMARMATTIDSISGGRFGVNLITGWQRPEYSQMGMWPGDEFFSNRYEYLGEYIKVCKELWETGKSDFKGEHFQMDDCTCCLCLRRRSLLSVLVKVQQVWSFQPSMPITIFVLVKALIHQLHLHLRQNV